MLKFFRRLFGIRDPIDDLVARGLLPDINRSITIFSAPDDPELWHVANERVGHISPKAVSDEYERLILKKYGR